MPRRQGNVTEPREEQEVSGKGRRFFAIVGRGGCGNGRRRIAKRIVHFFPRAVLIYSFVNTEMTAMAGDTYIPMMLYVWYLGP